MTELLLDDEWVALEAASAIVLDLPDQALGQRACMSVVAAGSVAASGSSATRPHVMVAEEADQLAGECFNCIGFLNWCLCGCTTCEKQCIVHNSSPPL